MTSFSKPYEGVAYFGVWASETADEYGKMNAVTVLAGAVDCCADDDMRQDREVRAALAYLARQGHDKRAMQFWRALDVQHPHERRIAAEQVLATIRVALGVSLVRGLDHI